MPADREIRLGVIFTGRVDAAFGSAVRRLTSAMNAATLVWANNMRRQADAAREASGNFRTMGSDLTNYQRLMGKHSGETVKFNQALEKMTSNVKDSSIGLAAQEQKLVRTEKAIQRHGETIRSNLGYTEKANRVANAFTQNIDRMGVVNRVTAEKMKLTANGLQNISSASTKAVAPTKSLITAHGALEGKLGQVTGAMDRIHRALKVTASYGIASAAIFGVVNALRQGVTEIINYDQALKNLQAITGATGAQVSAMGDIMIDIAKTTKFSTKEVAEGMVLLGQAGFDAGESMAAIRSVAVLATGTLSSMQLVTDLLTTTIRSFNLNAIEAGRVSDVMANAINKSKLTVDKLRIAFGYVGAIASQTGLNIEQTAASMGVLANNGLRASTIGTGLRQVLSRLISPNSKLREAYESHGIELSRVNPLTVGYETALKNLAFVLWDSEKGVVDMSKAFELFGLRGAQAAAILVKSYVSGDYQKMLKNIYEVGSATDMAGIQQEGLAVKIKNLADRFGTLAISVGKAGVAGALGILIDILKTTVAVVTDLVDSVGGKLVLQFAAWSASILLVLKAFQLLAATSIIKWIVALSISINAQIIHLGLWSTAVNLAWTAWARFMMFIRANPFLVVSVAIGAAVVALRSYFAAAKIAADETEKGIVMQQGIISSLMSYKGALEALEKKQKDGLDINLEAIALLKRLVTEHSTLKDKIEVSSEAWIKNKKAIEEAISEKNQGKLTSLTFLVNQYGEAIERARIKTGLWVGLKTVFEKLTDYILLFYQTVFNYFAKNIELMALFATKIPLVGEKISAALTIISETLRTGVENVKNFYSNLGKGSAEAAALTTKQGETVQHLADLYIDLYRAGTMSMEAITASVMDSFDLTREQTDKVLQLIREGLASTDTAIKSFSEMASDNLKSLGVVGGSVFKDLYESASAIQKSELAKMHKAMEAELASYKKWSDKNIKDAAERAEGLEAIRSKHYAKMFVFLEEANQKEIDAVKLAETIKLDILAQSMADDRIAEEKGAEDRGQIALDSAKAILDIKSNAYDRALNFLSLESDAFKKINQEKIEAEIDYNEKKRALEEAGKAQTLSSLNYELEKVKAIAAGRILELEKRVAREWMTEKEAAIEKGKIEQQLALAILNIREKLLAETKEIYSEDSAEYRKAANEKKEAELELLKVKNEIKAAEKELADEITKGSAASKSAEASTGSLAAAWAKAGGIVSIFKGEIVGLTEAMKSMVKVAFDPSRSAVQQLIQASVDQINTLLAERATISSQIIFDKYTSSKLTSAIDKSINQIKKETQQKINTLTDYWKKNPVIIAAGGPVVAETKAGGGLVGPFGDVVGPGEFVLPKNSVKKYGIAALEAMKNMTAPIQMMKSAMSAMSPSGMSPQGATAGNTFHITFAPQVMTGDTNAMRNAAVYFKKALADLDSRWGK